MVSREMASTLSSAGVPLAGRIFVCCPGGAVTGGPELLHQLVHALRGMGRDARICYFPFDRHFDKPAAYAAYDAPSAHIEDTPGSTVILPEVATRLARPLRQARVFIWWLSVDNYYVIFRDNALLDLVRRIRSRLRGRLGLSALKGCGHFTQSRYARDFLAARGIPSEMLTDCLGDAHLASDEGSAAREDIVLYNPRKGMRITRALIASAPDVRFLALAGLSAAGVREALGRAKVYIDFGHHPGKDRFPREAAMAGCCVITGRRGAAANDSDVPIPARYKLDERAPDFTQRFLHVAQAVFDDYDACAADFSTYRERIRAEPGEFLAQVRRIFLTPAGMEVVP